MATIDLYQVRRKITETEEFVIITKAYNLEKIDKAIQVLPT